MTDRIRGRIGRFRVSDRFVQSILDDAESGHNLFHNIIVIQATHDYARGCIEYVAVSPLFDEIGQGEMAPEYEATFCAGDTYPSWKQAETIP